MSEELKTNTSKEKDDKSTKAGDSELEILPDAFIPVVKTPIFEFVPYQPQSVNQAPQEDSFTFKVARQCEQHLLSRSFDLSKMTHS